MKKILKIAGAVAGLTTLAALVPYSINKNKEKDEVSIYALLWKYSNKPDCETPGNRRVSIDIGFHNPFKEEVQDLPPEDGEPAPDCEPAAQGECDIQLTLEPKLDEGPAAPAEPEECPADCQPETC